MLICFKNAKFKYLESQSQCIKKSNNSKYKKMDTSPTNEVLNNLKQCLSQETMDIDEIELHGIPEDAAHP